jgi:regulator of protease activity HflC (stomatin/prohibitin superfamily)
MVVGVLMMCIAIVPAGNVGVALQFGATTGDYKTQGLQFKSPVVGLVLMSIQTQKYEAKASAASEDLQVVTTDIALNYHLISSEAPKVYRDLGGGYIEIIAAPAIQETVKQITAKYKAEDLILKRELVKASIEEELAKRIESWGIKIDAVSMTNFDFSVAFNEAIETKVAALQAVAEAQNKLERVKVEAQQAEAEAIGKANATIAEANGQAKSIEIVTNAQMKANEEISKTLTPDVLQYILYSRLGQDVKIIVVPQGQSIVLPTQ